jgi:predicted 3-demethylubiquinone-9 3-methyltransferase (glyoxalase superfamily)
VFTARKKLFPFWKKLTAGEEMPCGWLKIFGVFWQVNPAIFKPCCAINPANPAES